MDLLLTSGQIEFLLKNREKIPDDFWRPTETNSQRLVIWIVNRQKPSVQADYTFAEERLGITKNGKIIFGFDSGCSCPSPWSDCGDSVYTEKTWKEFNINPDEAANIEWDQECNENLRDLILLVRDDVKPEEVFKARNSEIRRHLMKRIGFENIRSLPNFKTISKDKYGELFVLSELSLEQLGKEIPRADGYIKDFKDPELDRKNRETEIYVKVKDAASDREYCLFCGGTRFDSKTQSSVIPFKTPKEAIAWTFDIKSELYNPLIET